VVSGPGSGFGVYLVVEEMTLTGPDRDEVFQWDPSEPELMKSMILAGVQIQMPIEPLDKNPVTP